MKIEIEIIDRIYYNIEAFCEANGKDLAEYMADAVVERYNLDRYGDLNEKLTKKEAPKKTTTRKTVKKPEIEIETTKVVEEESKQPVVEEKPIFKTEEKPTIIETVVPTTEEQPKKTRRTLKTK